MGQSVRQALIDEREGVNPLRKGDVPGHPFHGNQYGIGANEGLGYTAQAIDRIGRATAVNDHGTALIHAANLLGMKESAKELHSIRSEHMRLGGITPKLMEQRQAVAARIDEQAKNLLSPKVYARYRSAF
jgi:hypothetical protein